MKFILTLETPKFLKLFQSSGMAHLGFIILINCKGNTETYNHEMIHIKQQREMFVIFWYVVYVVHFLYNFLIKYYAIFRSNTTKYFWSSYHDVILEIEAHTNDRNYTYLSTRKCYAWIRSNKKSSEIIDTAK